MTDQEINRAIQYVTASTSYGRDNVAEILRIGFTELTSLVTTSSRVFDRETLLEYVCQWTMKRTGYPEPRARIIHERFCCNRPFAAATSLHAAAAACRRAGSPLSRSAY